MSARNSVTGPGLAPRRVASIPVFSDAGADLVKADASQLALDKSRRLMLLERELGVCVESAADNRTSSSRTVISMRTGVDRLEPEPLVCVVEDQVEAAQRVAPDQAVVIAVLRVEGRWYDDLSAAENPVA